MDHFDLSTLPSLSLNIQLIDTLYGIHKKQCIFANINLLFQQISDLECNLRILADGFRIVQLRF